MGTEKNRSEALRWLQAARDDIKSAGILRDSAQYAHCCFHAQQAAEKALKSILYLFDRDPWGHSASKLLGDLQEEGLIVEAEKSSLHAHALVLDRFYVLTRYPNGLPDLSPDEAYSIADADGAVQYAEEFVSLAKKKADRG